MSELADRVFVALRDALMSGALPPGERLSENSLADRFQVSRTPVREAMARLLADGLIERRDRGLYPYRPSLADLEGLYELRTTVELRGIVRIEERVAQGLEQEVNGKHGAAPSHDHDVLGPELDRWQAFRRSRPRPDAGFVTEDERFHVQLLASSGNPALVSALELVNVRIRPVRMFDYLTEDRMEATIDEHIHVAERILAGELAAGREALTTHIEESRKVAIERASHAMSMADIVMALRT